jgi:hypothetical protein
LIPTRGALLLLALLAGLIRLGGVLQDAAGLPVIASDADLLDHILGADAPIIAAIRAEEPEDIAIAWRHPPSALALSRAQWLWLALPDLSPEPMSALVVTFVDTPPVGTVLFTGENLRLERRVRIRIR